MHHLTIADYAAIVATPGGPDAVLGLARGADALPMGLRRRMSRFEICAVRCVLGLVQPETEETLVLASRYGGMATAYSLLESLAAGDLLSPSDFSISVHNAAPGLASQIARNRAGHTAVASDARTFAAGLTEAAARIADGENSVVLIFAEQSLPDVYAEVEELDDTREVWLAMRLVPDTGGDAQDAGQGRSGVCALVEALESGRRRVAWRAGLS